MLDLIVLAFETDTTRVAAYQICAEDGVGICDRFPSILGIGRGGHHGLSHDNNSLNWAQYDRYLAEQFAYFLDRLGSIREGDSRLLDNTMALYGSGTSTTHNARNYPTILAGRPQPRPAPRPLLQAADRTAARRSLSSRCSTATTSRSARSPTTPASSPKSYTPENVGGTRPLTSTLRSL